MADPGTRRTRRAIATSLLACAVALAGCGPFGSSQSSNNSSSGTARTAGGDKGYGLPPTKEVTYQPDVVIVEGGASAIRSVSSDTLTWVIDGKAPHASDLQVGKIMFLTGRAVGKVFKLESVGNDIAVTLGPFDITDVIKDGHIDITQPIDFSKMSAQKFPEAPGVLNYTKTGSGASPSPADSPGSSPAPSGSPTGSLPPATFQAGLGLPVAMPPMRLATAAPLPPPTKDETVEASIGDFALELSKQGGAGGGQLSAKITYTAGGVTIGATFVTTYTNPVASVQMDIQGGKVLSGHARVCCLNTMTIKLDSGSETGLAGNFNSRIEFPVELNIPIEGAVVPFNLSIRFKAIVETAFSAKNSTLSATGEASLSGPLGFDYDGSNFVMLDPGFTIKQKPADTMQGVSVGVNGVVLAFQLKVLFGLGMEALQVGPFASTTVSYGLTLGSSLGIVKCHLSSVDLVASTGWGFTLAPGVAALLKGLLPAGLTPKLDSEHNVTTKTYIHDKDYAPQVKVCAG